MKKAKTLLSLVLMLAFILSLNSWAAETQEFQGTLKLGYRFLDKEGSQNKYREDFNLNSGGFLPEFSLHFSPGQSLEKLFDRLDISIRNLGNEPFQSFDVSLQKYGSYLFNWARRKSTYFYSDDYESGGGILYDLHSFNFDRVADSGSLKVWLGQNIQVYADYNAYTKQGTSVTTLDINRIEFEFDKPISESNREIAVGVTGQWKGYSLLFEERIQDYENDFGFFLPGFSDGGAGARYPSDLLYFTQNLPYDLKTYRHTFQLNARPLDGLLIKGSAQLSDMDMDLSYDESASGTNYLNRAFAYEVSGSGEFARKLQLLDLDVTWLFTHKLALVVGVRNHDFEQNGFITMDGDRVDQDFAYDTLGFDAGLQYQPHQTATITAGYRFEERNLDNLETFLYEEETTRHGIFGNLNFVPSSSIRINLDYQYGDYNNPYTFISPTRFNRLKAKARINHNQLYLSGIFQYSGNKNEALEKEPWESSKTQLTLRAGYHADDLKLFAGYSLMDVKHQVNRTVVYPPGWGGGAGTFPWVIDYQGKSTIWDASVSYEFSELARLGAYGNIYSNTGFWEIDRQMLKAYLQYDLPYGMFTEIALRYINLAEELAESNDYRASIFELNFGYRWQ